MDLEEFEDLVDRWGEDIGRWPASSRDQAAKLLRASAEARDILSRAAFLRRVVADVPPVRAPAGLADRITSAAVAQSRGRVDARGSFLGRLSKLTSDPLALRPVVLLSLCFLIGASAGLLFFPVQGSADQVDFPTLLVRVVN